MKQTAIGRFPLLLVGTVVRTLTIKMRADIIWPVAWGTCFIGGVILGSTGPVNVLAFGSSSPKLRGSERVATEQVRDAEI